MAGFTDRPTEKVDHDKLGMQKYINGLKSFILDCDTPMTIAIQGDWGSGKTSMMNMIKEAVTNTSNERKVKIVWFNTWLFSQFNMGEELAVSLMKELVKSFEVKKDDKEKFYKKLHIISKIVRNTALLATDTFIGGRVADAVQKGFSLFSKDNEEFNMSQEISKIKEEFQSCVKETLSYNYDRVVIFIDDLDRLQPSKAVELLETLKLFLDCEGCVYVLAIDYEVVTQGVKQKFGTMINEEKGRSFFDKIIQLPFKMPVAQYDIRKYLIEMLEKIGIRFEDAGKEKEINAYISIVQNSIGCNPRSMKRLFNSYLLLSKVEPAQNLEKDWMKKVLFSVLCMQLSFEKVYNYIAINRKSIDDSFLFMLGNKDTFEAYHDVNILKREFCLNDDDDINRLTNFMKIFNMIIDKDDDKKLSEAEIKDFINVLGYSMVTSEADDTIQTIEEIKWQYRRRNRQIVKDINSRIFKESNLEFAVYQSNKDSDEWKFHNAIGYRWFCKDSARYSVEFGILTDIKSKKSKFTIWFLPKQNTTFSDMLSILKECSIEKDQSFARTQRGLQKEYSLIYDDNDSGIEQLRNDIFHEMSIVLTGIKDCYDENKLS